MNVQITDVGLAALNANAGVITLSLCKIGDGHNYVPSPTDTDIHGNLVFSGVPSAPVAASANVVKYGFYMDYSVGDFSYGEFGLFMDNGQLFALGCSSSLYEKLKLTSNTAGNSVRIDIYLSVNNQNYDMWFDIGESNNQFRLAVLQSPDLLPQSKDATPNAYVVQGASPDQNAMLAFTDRNGLWTFDAYQFINQVGGTITGFDSQSVTIDLGTFTSDMAPAYFGQVILEFTSGTDYSVCRYVSSAVQSNGVVRLNFATPLLVLPKVGDTFIVFKRNPLSSSNVQIPIASATVLGGVKLSSQFSITNDGILSLNPTTIGWVLSVNGLTGEVELSADEIPGLATVAKTGNYSDLIGAPAAYVLPTASQNTLGGVKLPSNGNLTVGTGGVLDLGFAPVKTVKGVGADTNGNVDPPPDVGLTDPQPIPASSDLNTFENSGLFYTDTNTGAVTNAPSGFTTFVLEVVPFSTTGVGGNVVQRITSGTAAFIRLWNGSVWSNWIQMGGTPPAATTQAPGLVQVGNGLKVDNAGVLSSAILTVAGVAPSPNGNVPVTATSIGALSAANIGKPGGVAGLLTENAGTNTDPDYYYQNARLPLAQLGRGVRYSAGLWNASNNTVTTVSSSNGWTINSLQSTGRISVTIPDPADPVNSTVTVNVSAEGISFYVGTAGTTNLDGITSWAAGDIVESRNGVWRKSGANSVRTVQSLSPDVNGNIALTTGAVSAAIAGALEGRTAAGTPNSLSLYGTGGNPLYLNLGGGNMVYFGNGAGGTVAYVDNVGNATFTNVTAVSDIREKENIEPVSRPLRKLMTLRYFTYNLKNHPERRLLSTAAQDLQAVQPETVQEREDGKLGIYTEGHVALVGAAVQEIYHRLVAAEDGLRRALAKLNRLEKGDGNGN